MLDHSIRIRTNRPFDFRGGEPAAVGRRRFAPGDQGPRNVIAVALAVIDGVRGRHLVSLVVMEETSEHAGVARRAAI